MSVKFAMGLLIGAAAGAVLMHYLNTPEGKAFVEKVKDDISEMGEKVSDVAEDIIEKGRSIIQADEEKVTGTA
jgi:hypothetical protein